MREFLFDLADELRRFLQPLETSLTDERAFAAFVEKYGWVLDTNSFRVSDIQSAFDITDDAAAAANLVREIFTSRQATPPIQTYLELIDVLVRITSKIRTLSNVSAPEGLPAEAWRSLAEEVLDGLASEYLASYQPILHLALLLLGIVEEVRIDVGGAAGRVNYFRRRIVWRRLVTAFSQPDDLMREVYAWDDPIEPFKFEILFERLARCATLLRFPAELAPPDDELARDYFSPTNPYLPRVQELRISLIRGVDITPIYFDYALVILPIPPAADPNAAPDGFVISPSFEGTFPAVLLWPFRLELSGFFRSASGPRLEVHPGKATPVFEGVGDSAVNASVGIVFEGRRPQILFGSRFSHRIQVWAWMVRLRVAGKIDDPELELEVAFEKAQIIIDDSDLDSFLKEILGEQQKKWAVDFAIVWSSKKGLYFRGQGGLALSVPLNVTLGVVELDNLSLGLVTSGGKLQLDAGLSGRTQIGPITASIDNVGVKLTLCPVAADQPAGVFGDLDLSFGFKPPGGLGVVLDVGPITGGGFLSFDEANGRYAGVLQLDVYGIEVSAVGLLDTRLPGGAPGFSFLIIISTEFIPIQLGFGFTLNGVGGLAGLHRTIVVDALQVGVRNQSLDRILFPEDPVANAAQLISDLRIFFPPAEDRYVFGPMALIGWGTPTLLEAELGIILEVPDPVRLVLLGQISAHFPSKEAAIVELHIDALGVIDFGEKRLSIDASLHDSRVALFSIYGDMALRLCWGDSPNFVFSLGGFNPRFQPPAGFPALERLTIALGMDENPRISLQAYLALTSNSLQLGAKAELLAEAGDFSLYGWISFDALVIFSPFYFVVDFSAGVALRWDGDTFAGIHLNATLEGPAPWHVWGEASISILFFEITVDFDERFGEERREELPPADPWPLLSAAIGDARNWSATLPASVFRVVTLVPPDVTAPPVLVDPMGSVTLREKVVPLNRSITKFGETKPSGPGRYDVVSVEIGDEAVAWSTVRDFFPPGHFLKLSDDEKLSREDFEKMDAGVTIASEAVAHGAAIGREIDYETVIIDSPWDSRSVVPPYPLSLRHQLSMLGRGAAALSPLKRTGFERFGLDPRQPKLVALEEEGYVIASTTDLGVREDITPPVTQGMAYQALSDYVAIHPGEWDQLQVIAVHDLERAA